jgi:hypothetical protein
VLVQADAGKRAEGCGAHRRTGIRRPAAQTGRDRGRAADRQRTRVMDEMRRVDLAELDSSAGSASAPKAVMRRQRRPRCSDVSCIRR